jgi:hypothetical protein
MLTTKRQAIAGTIVPRRDARRKRLQRREKIAAGSDCIL